MYTKQQLLQALPNVPATFSLSELAALLSRPQPAPQPEPVKAPPRPASLTPEEAAAWDYYTSPQALALYTKFPVSDSVKNLHGIIQLPETEKWKTATEWRAEAIRAKFGA